MMPGRQTFARSSGPTFQVVPPLSDSTFVVIGTTPTAEGRYWTYVDAITEEGAMELAAVELPAPSLAFRLPTQRVRRFAKFLLVYGPIVAAVAILMIPILTWHFRRSAGFVVLGWAASFGYALVFELMVLFLLVSYLAILDLVCGWVGYRTLRERSRVSTGGTVLEGPLLEDIMAAFGPERVSQTVRLVNRGFGAALLLVLVLGVLTR